MPKKTAKPHSGTLTLLVIALLAALIAASAVAAGGARENGWFLTPRREHEPKAAGLLTLVNTQNPLESGYVPPLTEIENGYSADPRCAEALSEMLADCRAAGLSPMICSAYRSEEAQRTLFEDKVARVLETRGCSEAEAEEIAAQEVARPGTSEHQLGLAVDIVDASYQQLDTAQEETAVQQWLMAHCHEYGFILRYPTGKSHLTGIVYEPWHYRYVGEEAAREMAESGKCFEEYLAFR
ncbi:MAG: M15 family metallopeptidase [Oscillospiraceae bacterium]|nr:M15 family metallopeptidase [Oscillospiraceae bacterium]